MSVDLPPSGTVADWVHRAGEWHARGDSATALACIQRAIEACDDPAGLLLQWGLDLLADRQAALAIPVLDSAWSHDPENPWVPYYLGKARQMAGQSAESIQSFRHAFRLDGHFVAAMTEALLLLMDDHRQKEATSLAALICRSVPDDPVALGISSLLAGRHDEARAHVEAAVRLEPEDVPAWILLGKICLILGREPEARRAYQQALALEPGRPDCLDAMATIGRA